MARLGRLIAAFALVALPSSAFAADEEEEKKEASTEAEAKPGEKPAEPAPAAEARGPAEDLVVEASHKPLVAHGPMFHLGLGWAWSIKYNQSLGLEVFADGMFDGERTTGGSTAVGGRYGAAAYVIGEKAHVRVGGGWASNNFDGANYQGLSVSFAAGWHVQMMPGSKSWKRPTFTFDVASSWDFLAAGDETLHRWLIGLLAGVAIY
jgi:hypothetical protein